MGTNGNVYSEYKNDVIHTFKLQDTKQELTTELILLEIKRIPYAELVAGEEIVIQEGFDGKKNVYYNVSFHEDTELGRTFAYEEITQGPIHQII